MHALLEKSQVMGERIKVTKNGVPVEWQEEGQRLFSDQKEKVSGGCRLGIFFESSYLERVGKLHTWWPHSLKTRAKLKSSEQAYNHHDQN